MKDETRKLPHIGDTVKLIGKARTATVIAYVTDVDGGVVLDTELAGFRCWNKNDLEILPRRRDSRKAG